MIVVTKNSSSYNANKYENKDILEKIILFGNKTYHLYIIPKNVKLVKF